MSTARVTANTRRDKVVLIVEEFEQAEPLVKEITAEEAMRLAQQLIDCLHQFPTGMLGFNGKQIWMVK